MDVSRYELPYKPPLAWAELLEFIAGRTVRGVEIKDGDTYRRTVRWEDRIGVVSAQLMPGRDALRVELSASLAGATVPVLARVNI